MAAYADLGKNAKKILTEGYNGHSAKVTINHGLTQDCTVTTSTALDTQTADTAYAIDLATKLVSKDKGVTVVDKRGINKEWAGSHSLVATVAGLCDVNNLVLTADSKGKLTLAYKNNFLNESIDYVQETQMFKPTLCLSKNDFAAGLQTTVSLLPGFEHGPKGTSIAAGYLGKTIAGHIHADNDASSVGCSLWCRKGNLEGAVQGSQVLRTSAKFGELGSRYSFAPDFFVGAKIDTDQNVGLCIKKALNDNLSISTSISTLLNDMGNLQIGAGVDFSHNFELLRNAVSFGLFKPAVVAENGSNNAGNGSNNSSRTTKQLSLTAGKHSKQRVGATSKELGDNCTDPKCEPVRRYWE